MSYERRLIWTRRRKVTMDKWKDWWKRDERGILLVKSVLLAVLPLVCCLVYCAGKGRGLGEVYLPASEWNDELFYYKQVEGMISHGYPLGYFGFNESHALKLSFAAWSPVLVLPWVVWGKLFGWNLMAPVLCNIFLMSLSVFLFVWLVRPSWKQLGILTVLFCLYTPFVRYMLSVMPEVICFSMLIVFYALAINYLRCEKGYKLALLFMISGVLTLMRPYMLLFVLLPAWFWIRRSKWKGAVGALAVMASVLGLYAYIKHAYGAEYFAPLFFTDWVTAFFEQGFFGGIRYGLGKLYYMGKDFLQHTRQGFRTGLASGAFFAGYLVCMFVLIGQSLRDYLNIRKEGKGRRRKGNIFMIEAHLAFSSAAMFFALLLMYKLTEGSKHLLTFMAAALFIIALMETKFYKKAVLVGVTFAYFYSYMAVDDYDYLVPFVQEERQACVNQWQEALAGRLVIDMDDVPSYDNVVIWVLYDAVGDTNINTQWQLLYALPDGFGISCCMPEYVGEHFDTLQSRYICMPPGGVIESRCVQAGYTKIVESEKAVMYQRY